MSAPMRDRVAFEPRLTRRGKLRSAASMYLALVMVMACSDGTVTPGATERLTKLAGDAQAGTDGEWLQMSPRVSITDASGVALAGRAVTFVVTSGGGSVSVTSANTATDGSVATEWRLGSGTASNTLQVQTRNAPPVTFTATSRAPAGTFALTGSMSTERVGHTATLLRDGRVLIAGGEPLPTAELYDPATGSFVPTANTMSQARTGHSATLLPDGRVLIAGGAANEEGATRGADLFDPATNRFVPTGDMLDPQWHHEGTLLPSGEVLIAGGFTSRDADHDARAELFNPATGTFRYTGAYADVLPVEAYRTSVGIPATLLSNGTVLLASSPRAQVYDPATGTFTRTGAPLGANLIQRTATVLTNGNVLLTGGSDNDVPFSNAELYDAAAGVFRTTMHMEYTRAAHTTTRLASGRVLIAGGESDDNCSDGSHSSRSGYGTGYVSTATAEVFDVNGLTWTGAGSMKISRQGHRATPLRDGRVLITGGGTVSHGCSRAVNGGAKTAELFTERP